MYIADIATTLGASIDDHSFIQNFEREVMLQPRQEKELLAAFTKLAALYGKGVAEAGRCVELLLTAQPTQTAYPETLEILRALRPRYGLAMITNTSQPTFAHLQQLYPIDELFDVVVTSYETGLMKPDRAVYEYTLDRCGVTADQAVMVGDSLEADYNGARAAGLRAVLLDRTNRYPEITERIANLTALPDWLTAHL